MRIELAVGFDLRETLALEHGGQLAMHEAHALFKLRLGMLLSRPERPLEVVHDREQLLDQPLCSTCRKSRLLASGPLLVVLELGREALEVVQVLLGLRLGGDEGIFDDPLVLRSGFVELFLGRIGHQEVFASSSTISASSITSSSEVEAPFPSGPPEAC